MTKRRTTVPSRKRKYPVATWNAERQAIDVDGYLIPLHLTTVAGRPAMAEIENVTVKRGRRRKDGSQTLTVSADVDPGSGAARLECAVPWAPPPEVTIETRRPPRVFRRAR